MEVSFKISNEDDDIVTRIMDRWVLIFGNAARLDRTMDIVAAHANGNPLDLQRLLDSNAGDFVHDLEGIFRNLNRANGQLMNKFLPRSRCAQCGHNYIVYNKKTNCVVDTFQWFGQAHNKSVFDENLAWLNSLYTK